MKRVRKIMKLENIMISNKEHRHRQLNLIPLRKNPTTSNHHDSLKMNRA